MEKERLDLYRILHSEVEQEAYTILKTYQKIKKEILNEKPKSLFFIDIDGDSLRYIVILVDNELNLPLSYLTDPNWEIGARDRILYDKSLSIRRKKILENTKIQKEKNYFGN